MKRLILLAPILVLLCCGFGPKSPIMTTLNPVCFPVGQIATFDIYGANFTGNAIVYVNGSPRPTLKIDSTHLQVPNMGSSVPTVFYVQVANGVGRNVQVSNVMTVGVTAPIALPDATVGQSVSYQLPMNCSFR